MQKGRSRGGYTIVEVMIFLAVSGFMFVVAASFISGKQSSTQFVQAVNTVNAQIQQLITNVSDNNYAPTSLQCTSNSGGSPPLTITSTGGQQGTNLGCDFLGKVIQFGVKGSNGRNFDIYTIAGCQYANCTYNSADPTASNPPSSFSEAKAEPVDPGTNNTCSSSGTTPNLTTCNTLEWGMEVTSMWDDTSGTPQPTNSIGLFNSFAPTNGGGLVSGSQTINVVDTGFGNININNASNVDEAGMVSLLEGNGGLDNAQPITSPSYPYFVVCFKDGKGHAGELTIGGSTASGKLNTSATTSNSNINLFNSPSYYCYT
ncbi:MAG TPA: type II secretion system protein [Candidatus Saccharimonadales bacterium]|nr:type II secretion system protein [Candidatus Saccharimonadales bacterium]